MANEEQFGWGGKTYLPGDAGYDEIRRESNEQIYGGGIYGETTQTAQPDYGIDVPESERSYFEDPQRIVAYNNMIRIGESTPGWKPPEGLPVEQIKQGYSILKFLYEDAPESEWKPLKSEDPARQFLKSIPQPPMELMLPADQEKYSAMQSEITKTLALKNQPYQEVGDWDNLSWSRQVALALTAAADSPELKDRPSWTRIPAVGVQGVMAGIAPAALGAAIGGPIGAGAAFLVFGGIGAYQAYTGERVPLISDIYDKFQIPARAVESAIGSFALDLTPEERAKFILEGNLNVIGQIFGAKETREMAAGRMKYETMPPYAMDALIWSLDTAYNLGSNVAGLFGGGWEKMQIEQAGKGYRWDIQKGINDPVRIQGAIGDQALKEYYDKLVRTSDANFDKAIEEIEQDAYERFGYSGVINDLAFQTVIDPLNFAPFLEGVGTAKAAKLFKKMGIAPESMGRFADVAGRMQGNPLLDVLPIGVQQLAETIIGKGKPDFKPFGKDIGVFGRRESSRGLMGILQEYKSEVRRGVFFSSDIIQSGNLGKLDRMIGGLTDDLKLREYVQVEESKSAVGKAVQNLVNTTPEAKGIGMIAMIADNLEVLGQRSGDDIRLFDQDMHKIAQSGSPENTQRIADAIEAASLDPEELREIKRQEAQLDSPVTRTIAESVGAALKKVDEAGLLGQWDATKNHRDLLLELAKLRKEAPGVFLDNVIKDAQRVYSDLALTPVAEKLNRLGISDGAKLKETFDIFIGEGDDKLPWHPDEFKAIYKNMILDEAGKYLTDKIGIKPDGKTMRMIGLLKEVQSLILLGLNPAYFMNNTINNIVTRAVEGVFGFMTQGQIETALKRMKMENISRLRVGVGASGAGTEAEGLNMVHRAKIARDTLENARRAVRSINNKIGIFQTLSQKVERAESLQAYTIGMLVMWNKVWKVGVGIDEMAPNVAKALDMEHPGVRQAIYDAAESGMNMEEIKAKLKLELIKPEVRSVMDRAVGKIMNGKTPDEAQAFRDAIVELGLVEDLTRILDPVVDPEDVAAVIDNLRRKVEDNIRQKDADFIRGKAEEIPAMAKAEGTISLLHIFTDVIEDGTDLYLNHFKEMADLAYKHRGSSFAVRQKAEKNLILQHERQFNEFHQREIASYKGIIDAVGLTTESSQRFVLKVAELNKLTEDYISQRNAAKNELFDNAKRGDEWKEKYKAFKDEQMAAYEAYNKQRTALLQEKDALFGQMALDYYNNPLGKKNTESFVIHDLVMNWRKMVMELETERQSAMEAMRKELVREDLKGTERNQAWEKFHEDYTTLVKKIYDLEIKGANDLVSVRKATIEKAPPAPEPEPVAKPPEPAAQQEAAPAAEPEVIITPEPVAETYVAGSPEAIARVFALGVENGIEGLLDENGARYVSKVKGKLPLGEQHLVNTVNKYTGKKGTPEAYTRVDDIPVEEAQRAFEVRKVEKAEEAAAKEREKILVNAWVEAHRINDLHAKNLADAELMAAGRAARTDIENGFRDIMGAKEDQVKAMMFLVDKAADKWAKDNGFPPNEASRNAYLVSHLKKILGEEGDGGLPQDRKGQINFEADGKAIIRGMKSADFTTMVHEFFHIWIRDLSDADVSKIIKYTGANITVGEYYDIRRKWDTQKDLSKWSQAEKEMWKELEKVEEVWATGGEEYFLTGKAPTPTLRILFAKFKQWMAEVYQTMKPYLTFKMKNSLGEWVNEVDIKTEINGIRLDTIYNKFFDDQAERGPRFDDILKQELDTPANRSEDGWIAKREAVKKVLGQFESEDVARKSLEDMLVRENETLVDEEAGGFKADVISDALDYIEKDKSLNFWNEPERAPMVEGGQEVFILSPDNQTEYKAHYAVVELKDIINDTDWFGDQPVNNPRYPRSSQNRIRGQVASQAQMLGIAKKIIPASLLHDTGIINNGAPIIGRDYVVDAGNGRIGALKYAADYIPDSYQKYRDNLDVFAAKVGITPDSYLDMKNPVLVRIIDTPLTESQRSQMAFGSNAPTALERNPFEIALTDKDLISDEALDQIKIPDEIGIEQALRSRDNDWLVKIFKQGIPESELGKLIDGKGIFNSSGYNRIINALVAKVFPGEDGRRILDIIANGEKTTVAAAIKEINNTLPLLAKLEAKIATGNSSPEYSIANDVAWAIQKVKSLRDDKLSVAAWLLSENMFGQEGTPLQRELVAIFDNLKKPTIIRAYLKSYAEIALSQRNPKQMDTGLFAMEPVSQADIHNAAKKAAGIVPKAEIEAIIKADIDGVKNTSFEPGLKKYSKEPWQMTADEYLATPEGKVRYEKALARQISMLETIGNGLDAMAIRNNALGVTSDGGHLAAIKKALSEGKEISPDILVEYGSYLKDFDLGIQPAQSVDAKWAERAREFEQQQQASMLPDNEQAARKSWELEPGNREYDVAEIAINNYIYDRVRQHDPEFGRQDRSKFQKDMEAGTVEAVRANVWEELRSGKLPDLEKLVIEAVNKDSERTRIAKGRNESFDKEPWEVTLEIAKSGGKKEYGGGTVEEIHRRTIEKALSEGKPVPPEVLADYPDLVKTEQAVQSGESVSIPFMITNDMKARLREMGAAPEEIRNMTPQQAWDYINSKPELTTTPDPEAAVDLPIKPLESNEPFINDAIDLANKINRDRLKETINKGKVIALDDVDAILDFLGDPEDPDSSFNFDASGLTLGQPKNDIGGGLYETNDDAIVFRSRYDAPQAQIRAFDKTIERPKITHQMRPEVAASLSKEMGQDVDAGQILTAYDSGKKAFVLSNGTGTGKTYVGAGVLAEMKPKKAVIFAPNEQIANAWMDVLRTKFGIEVTGKLSDYGKIGVVGPGVYWDTYTGAGIIGKSKMKVGTDWDLIIFDESHRLKNYGKGTVNADSAVNLYRNSKNAKVLFLSATPYQSLDEMRYLAPLGLWGPSPQDFDNFLIQHGYTKVPGFQEGSMIWRKSETQNIQEIINVRRQMIESGVFSQRELTMDKSLDNIFRRVAMGKYRPYYDQVNAAFNKAIAMEWNPKKKGVIESQRTLALRRVMELSKIETAIPIAQKALAEGKQVAVFVQFKGELNAPEIKKHMQLSADIESIYSNISDKAAIQNLVDALGGNAKVSRIFGEIPEKSVAADIKAYNSGAKKVAVVTTAKGGVGLSLHDVSGNAPRVQINITLPWSGQDFTQVAGRSYRYGTKTDTIQYWLFSDAMKEQEISSRVAGRLREMGAVVKGIHADADVESMAAFDFGELDTVRDLENILANTKAKKGVSDVGLQAEIIDPFALENGKVIRAIAYFNGEKVSYIPNGLRVSEVGTDSGGKKYQILGYDVNDTDRLVFYLPEEGRLFRLDQKTGLTLGQPAKKKYQTGFEDFVQEDIFGSQTKFEDLPKPKSNKDLPLFGGELAKAGGGDVTKPEGQMQLLDFVPEPTKYSEQFDLNRTLPKVNQVKIYIQKADGSYQFEQVPITNARQLVEIAEKNKNAKAISYQVVTPAGKIVKGGDDLKKILGQAVDAYNLSKSGEEPGQLTLGQPARRNLWNYENEYQEFDSSKTSINSRLLPKIFNLIDWQENTINADIGGGRFDNATDYLREKGVANVIFDPYNRDKPHNNQAIAKIAGGKADTATLSNLLNVIKEPGGRAIAIERAYDAVKPGGKIYITVYEGDGSGVGSATKSGWQENRKLREYLQEVQSVISGAKLSKGMIVAEKPDIYSQMPTNLTLGQPDILGKTPVGKTPGNLYDAEWQRQALYQKILPALDQFEEIYKQELSYQIPGIENLSKDSRDAVNAWVNRLNSQMTSAKLASQRYGEMARDNSLLNYSMRYGIDNYVTSWMPYSFWYLRTMMKWGERMIDRPAWFSLYARLKEAQKRVETKGLPSRFAGRIKYFAPWLPDWSGGSFYADPLKQLFPLEVYTALGENMEYAISNVDRNAQQYLYSMVEAKEITMEQYEAAIANKNDPLYQRAYEEAIKSSDLNNPVSLASMMMSPGLWITIPNAIASGTPEKISVMPATKTARAIGTALKGTPFEALGNFIEIVGAGPEKAIRKNAGLSPYGQWGDYYIDRELANLAADGEYSTTDVMIAMIDRKGAAYDAAEERVRLQEMYKTPIATVMQQIAKTIEGSGKVSSIAGSLITLTMPFGIFPEGELKQRGLANEYSAAWKMMEAGDMEAINKFFDEHPEYQARLAINKEPDERLKNLLIDQIWDRYMAVPSTSRRLVAEGLGTKFQTNFLNNETYDYETIDIPTLAFWAQALGGQMPEKAGKVGTYQLPMLQTYTPAMGAAIQKFLDTRDEKFPGVTVQQSLYYDNGEDRAILERFPQIKKYWDWKKQYEKEHPELRPYFEQNREYAKQKEKEAATIPEKMNYTPDIAQDKLSPEQMQMFPPELVKMIYANTLAGEEMSEGAIASLEYIWEALGKPNGTLDDWYKNVVKTTFGG